MRLCLRREKKERGAEGRGKEREGRGMKKGRRARGKGRERKGGPYLDSRSTESVTTTQWLKEQILEI